MEHTVDGVKHTLKYECECKSCGGVGLYVGMGERDGASVVCHDCKGTGRREITVEWRDFTGAKIDGGIKWVVATNCGWCIGERAGVCSFSDFGGMSYREWLDSGRPSAKEFPLGTEDRQHVCPAWFYQSTDYERKPSWDDEEQKCGFGAFSACKHFSEKHKCWERFDLEQGRKES